MKLTAKLTNLGISLSLHEGNEKPLEPAADADQKHPRRNYIYAHLDSHGRIFYIGTGVGRRAWSEDRHPIWHRYVKNHLGGHYSVQILQDDLLADEAEELEASWIAQCSDGLVNWFNAGRDIDLEALDEHNRLRDGNRALIQKAKTVEKVDLGRAADMYVQAIDAIAAYAVITYEKGLVGQLLEEEAAEIGVSGELEALDRLTICLVKLGRPAEAARHAEGYFSLYRADRERSAYMRISKRIEKALAREAPPGSSPNAESK